MNYANDAALGISSTETTRNIAANELYGKSFKDLSEAQKQLTLLKQVEDANRLSGALGQAAREGSQFENVTGNLAQAWQNFKVAIGGNFLDLAVDGIVALTNVVRGINVEAISQGLTVIVGRIRDIAESAIPILINGFNLARDVISSVISFVVPIIDRLREAWQSNSEEIYSTASTVFENVRDVIQNVVTAVLSFVQPQLEKLRQFWSENGEQILQAVQNAFNAIKAVIDFVMPAILLIIRIVWGAIQDVISGALNVIMGLVKVFSGIFTGDFSKLWEGIKQIFIGAIDLILGVLTLTFFGGIRAILTNLAKTGISIIRGLWDDALNLFRNFANGGTAAVRNLVDNVLEFFRRLVLNALQFIRELQSQGVKYIQDLATGMIKAIASLPGRFLQFGKDIITGLINGLKSLNPIGVIADIAGGIIDKAKDIFKINSPSKVFTEIGGFVSEGLQVGVSKGAPGAVKAVNDLAAATIQAARKKIQDEYNLEVEAIKSNETLTAKKKEQDLKALEDKRTADADLIKLISETVQERKRLGEISVVDEAVIWQKTLETLQVGSSAYTEAQIKYRDTLNSINETIISTNETFQKRVTAINDKLLKDEQELTAAYEKAYNDRYNSLLSFSGLFEEFGVTADVTGDGLIRNLQSQVTGFEDWQNQIQLLSTKAIDQGLLAELRKAGPGALAELRALNSLTDVQLQEYSNLFVTRSKLAREQTDLELNGLRKQTEGTINRLRITSRVQLSEIQDDWTEAISKIVSGTEDGFSSLEDVGRNAGLNLYNGLSSVESSLIAKARSIASSVQAALASALNVSTSSINVNGLTAPSSVGSASNSSVSNNNKTQVNNITVQSNDQATAMQREVRKLNFGF